MKLIGLEKGETNETGRKTEFKASLERVLGKNIFKCTQVPTKIKLGVYCVWKHIKQQRDRSLKCLLRLCFIRRKSRFYVNRPRFGQKIEFWLSDVVIVRENRLVRAFLGFFGSKPSEPHNKKGFGRLPRPRFIWEKPKFSVNRPRFDRKRLF